jgi:hypothetical protein
MHQNIVTPEEDEEDDGPWDWARTSERYVALSRKPGYLRPVEAREMVAIERRMGALIAHYARGGI